MLKPSKLLMNNKKISIKTFKNYSIFSKMIKAQSKKIKNKNKNYKMKFKKKSKINSENCKKD